MSAFAGKQTFKTIRSNVRFILKALSKDTLMGACYDTQPFSIANFIRNMTGDTGYEQQDSQSHR